MFDSDIDRVRQGVAVFNTLHHKKKQRPFSLEEEEHIRPAEQPAVPHPPPPTPEPGHQFDKTA